MIIFFLFCSNTGKMGHRPVTRGHQSAGERIGTCFHNTAVLSFPCEPFESAVHNKGSVSKVGFKGLR